MLIAKLKAITEDFFMHSILSNVFNSSKEVNSLDFFTVYLKTTAQDSGFEPKHCLSVKCCEIYSTKLRLSGPEIVYLLFKKNK